MTLERISGLNSGYVLELYEKYRQDPQSVDPASRAFFQSWVPADAVRDGAPATPASGPLPELHVIVGAANLAESIRRFGHLAAKLDPLGSAQIGDSTLLAKTHGITDDDLKRLPASLVGGPPAEKSANAFEAIEKLRRVYCSTTGFDIAHLFVPEERAWMREAAESGRYLPALDPASAEGLLDRITQVEVFERFLQRTFTGKTRFSIEGLDMLLPILDEIMAGAAGTGTRHMMLGMAHRGRLNVLAHILQKPYAQILAEFKDPIAVQMLRLDLGFMGDVKYHAGGTTESPAGAHMWVTMAPNPSHLEAVNPVVAGMARAAGTLSDRGGAPIFDGTMTMPVLIHGDAAFPGQGIVAETLNLSRLDGYHTDGTIHIIANNQLGFTATPGESYSTSYASGLARGFKIPIVHVNADDPAACIEAARMAWEYRARFHKDFLIDLVGYRRHGHNEGDEPAFTQPVMYKAIDAHKTARELFAESLVKHGTVAADVPEALVRKHYTVLEQTFASLKPEEDFVPPIPTPATPGLASKTQTGVPIELLRDLSDSLLSTPDGFHVHKKLERIRERKRAMLAKPGERTVDWGSAEELALATILAEGTPIRLTGEDVQRGTFSHRHAVLHDAETGVEHVPLQRLPQARGSFEIHNSPLTEAATIGFEFGYNMQEPGHLVIWEAQYGDFINGAQIILDQFVTSGRSKWGLKPSLVFLLPHGYEGQGPEHSSARPERFLQAAADINMRLVNCTTAAQYFHVLRRQAALLEKDPLPLVILTPKSLLRHPAVSSTPQELTEGHFRSVLDDSEAAQRAKSVRRLVLCSGKVYVDLISHERRAGAANVAIVRVEQLYPFPNVALKEVLDRYPSLAEVAWVQEEPSNMGAWEFMWPRLEELIGDRCGLRYIGRARNSSPSEGSSAWHQVNQKMLVELAFDLKTDMLSPSVVWSKPIRSLAPAAAKK
jgi:2-oxoglutarate dehydrogenase E1 component